MLNVRRLRARARASVTTSSALVLWFALGAVAAAQEPEPPPPEIPPGWVLVDDVILPADAVYGDSTYSATPWTGGVVPYVFDANVSAADQLVGIDAMAEWAAAANVTFVPRTTETNYIRFYTTNSNSSFVGMIGGMQTINVYNWNFRFIVCHEICHALGFWHEQSRPDRNTYVTINFANIDPAYAYNFNVVNGATTYGAYDFDSVMHYGAYAFSVNNQPTITINPGYSGSIGQRQHLSVLDATGMATQYGAAPAPTIASLSPTTVGAGNPTFTLTVNGTRFCRGRNDSSGMDGTTVEWNGVALATTYVSPTQMLATVPASLVASSGVHNVTVYNPSPGGGVSLPATFTVGIPPPVASGLVPASALVGAATTNVTVTGTFFQPTSVVRWNGADLPTTYVGSTSLTASVASGLFGAAATVPVTVFTPAPGGGTSSAVNFSVLNPVPLQLSTTPTTAPAGSGPFNVTVNGVNFNSQTVVRWNGVPVPTTFVSATQVVGAVSAAQAAPVGTATVSVQNPAPGGGASPGATFTLSNGTPVVATLSPATLPQGAGAFTLTVNGTGMNGASVVKWNNANRTTTFVSGTQVTAAILASDLAAQGTATVKVQNAGAGGGTSNTVNFTIAAPGPTISLITPSSAIAGAAGFALSVFGTNYVAGSVVRWNGADLATTFNSASLLTATVPASLVAAAGAATVAVHNSATGFTSNPATFTVHPGAPVLSSAAPSQATLGSGATAVTVGGSGFVAASVVRWNGANLATTFVSPTQLTATVPATNLAAVGTASLTVFTPAPGGGTSGALTFTVGYPTPTVSLVAPSLAAAGTPGLTITVTGTGFYAGGVSVVRFDGAATPTTYVSPTQLTAAVPASAFAAGGSKPVVVANGGPLGGTSAPVFFGVLNPPPLLFSVSPNVVTAGDAAFTLTANGFAFNASTVLRWNGSPLATTYVGPTQVQALIPASLIVAGGAASITAHNPPPGGGTTATQTLTVQAPIVNAMTPAAIAPLLPSSPAVALTLSGTGFLPSSVVWANGVALTTTYGGPNALSASLPASVPQTQGQGGVSVTVRNGGTTLSNTRALVVGSSANAGTTITDPPSATPPYGGTFALVLEGGAPFMPFTLLSDLAATPTVAPFPSAAENQALDVGSPSMAVLLDGLGLFGPPLGVAFGGPTGSTPPGGAFTLPGIAAPAAPSGVELALQFLYVDPTSPFGWRLGWAAQPRHF